jgi:hypothetical protein
VTDLFDPLTPPNPAAVARKCRRHEWPQSPVDCGVFNCPRTVADPYDDQHEHCLRCGHIKDHARVRRNRNNRTRGNREELTVARILPEGRKVGPLGFPWDVEVPGFLRLQVKKLAGWPSLAKCIAWLDAIPAGRELRGVAVVQAAGQGVKPRRIMVIDLDEFASWYGEVPTE